MRNFEFQVNDISSQSRQPFYYPDPAMVHNQLAAGEYLNEGDFECNDELVSNHSMQ